LLHARLPRVRCPEHGVRQVSVPWARPGSGFTLLFEALVCSFAAVMPMAKVAAMTREHDTRIWRIVEHHVGAARDQEDFTGVGKVGMDETSACKGQDYVSIFADMVAGRVLFATEGRDAATVALSRACHDNRVSHGWTKIGRCDHHSVGKGTICESGHEHRRS
jgi:transposase